MGGVYLDLVRQRQKLLVKASVQARGVLARFAGEVRPADGPGEERVTRDHEPRCRATTQVGHDERDALGSVPGRVQHPDTRVPEPDLFSVIERGEAPSYGRRAVQAIFRPDLLRQRRPTRQVVRMHVRIEHVGDSHPLVPRERDVVVDLRMAGVDHGAEPLPATAEQVRRAAVLEVEEGPEYHRGCAEVCTGRPDALHSGNPSVSRRARRPRARSLATAS